MKKKYIFISVLSLLCIILMVYVPVKLFSFKSTSFVDDTFDGEIFNYDAIVDELLAMGNNISGEKIDKYINMISNLNMKDNFPFPICIKVRSDLSGDILLTNDDGSLKDSDFVNKFIFLNKNYEVRAFDNIPEKYNDGITDELLIWSVDFENMSGE